MSLSAAARRTISGTWGAGTLTDGADRADGTAGGPGVPHCSEAWDGIGWEEGFDPFYGAPVILIVLAKRDSLHRVYDGSLVMGNLMLAAHALGIGSCWIHRAREEFETEEGIALLRSLGITEEYEGIGHCALGYVDGEYPSAPARKENWVYYIR